MDSQNSKYFLASADLSSRPVKKLKAALRDISMHGDDIEILACEARARPLIATTRSRFIPRRYLVVSPTRCNPEQGTTEFVA